MQRTLTSILLVLSLCGLSPPRAGAADDGDMEIQLAPAAWDWLELSYRCRNLFSIDVRRTLESGLPARVHVDIELWQDRSHLWDRHVVTVELGYRIVFDVLEARYEVFDDRGEYVTSSKDLEDVQEVVGSENALELAPLDDLEGDAEYFVVMEVRLEPLSVHEIEDLERWIRGSMAKEGRGRGLSGISSHLLGVLKNQVGMGERKGFARSATFRPDELRARAPARPRAGG